MAARFLAWVTNVLYGAFSALPAEKKIVFMSRQSSRPFDFVLLEKTLVRYFPDYDVKWLCVSEIGKMSFSLMIKQLYHMATSQVCFADGYVPAVCIPQSSKRPICIQLWHAMGAIKKFGYQCLDTPAGRSSKTAKTLSMHRGYDYVIAGASGAVEDFSKAFDMPKERILPLGLPRGDYLRGDCYSEERLKNLDLARKTIGCEKAEAGKRKIVLYAPTFRKGASNPAWYTEYVRDLLKEALRHDMTLVVTGHPLQRDADSFLLKLQEEHNDAFVFSRGVSSMVMMELADYVVTDYSAVAFEAALSGKKVFFYVPDIDEYRSSPGLNIDPLESLPGVSFCCAEDLFEAMARCSDDEAYEQRGFWRFMDMYGVGASSNGMCAENISLFVKSALEAGD